MLIFSPPLTTRTLKFEKLALATEILMKIFAHEVDEKNCQFAEKTQLIENL